MVGLFFSLSLTPQTMADGPPYGIEKMRVELWAFVFRQLYCETDPCETYVIDGTMPMMLNPIPKTSNGVKLRLSSVCLVCHVGSAPVKDR